MLIKIGKYLMLNLIFLFIISLNVTFTSRIVDFSLIVALIIYVVNWSQNDFFVPIFIFFWGIYQDILISLPLGYSGLIFLFFYLINYIISIYGVFNYQSIKFAVLIISMSVYCIIRSVYVFLALETQSYIFIELLSLLIMALLFFPINNLYLILQKEYAKVR